MNIAELSDDDPDHRQTHGVHVGGMFSKTCQLHCDDDTVHQQVDAFFPQTYHASVICIHNHHCRISSSNSQRSSLDLTSAVWGASSSWSPLFHGTERKCTMALCSAHQMLIRYCSDGKKSHTSWKLLLFPNQIRPSERHGDCFWSFHDFTHPHRIGPKNQNKPS